tara:strand:+ start:1450 stop:2085 length:636 start_codon:yes stop_codon:yes gene_type:complete
MGQRVYRYFHQLPFTFKQDKLEEALKQVLKIAPWPDKLKHQQICLTRKKGVPTPDCYYEGNGGVYQLMLHGKEETRQQELDESDYSEFIHSFNHTYFRELYEILDGYCMATYSRRIGRVRLNKSIPRTSLSWHRDPEPRVHIPIITDEGNMQIIEDEVLHMKVGEGWYADTENYHSQFNGSEVERVHLVATLYKWDNNQIQEDWTTGNDYY